MEQPFLLSGFAPALSEGQLEPAARAAPSASPMEIARALDRVFFVRANLRWHRRILCAGILPLGFALALHNRSPVLSNRLLVGVVVGAILLILSVALSSRAAFVRAFPVEPDCRPWRRLLGWIFTIPEQKEKRTNLCVAALHEACPSRELLGVVLEDLKDKSARPPLFSGAIVPATLLVATSLVGVVRDTMAPFLRQNDPRVVTIILNWSFATATLVFVIAAVANWRAHDERIGIIRLAIARLPRDPAPGGSE